MNDELDSLSRAIAGLTKHTGGFSILRLNTMVGAELDEMHLQGYDRKEFISVTMHYLSTHRPINR